MPQTSMQQNSSRSSSSPPSSSSSSSSSPPSLQLLYKSWSLCPICSFQQHRGFQLKPCFIVTVANEQNISSNSSPSTRLTHRLPPELQRQDLLSLLPSLQPNLMKLSTAASAKVKATKLAQSSAASSSSIFSAFWTSSGSTKRSLTSKVRAKEELALDSCLQAVYSLVICDLHPLHLINTSATSTTSSSSVNLYPVLLSSSLTYYLHLLSYDHNHAQRLQQRSQPLELEELASRYHPLNRGISSTATNSSSSSATFNNQSNINDSSSSTSSISAAKSPFIYEITLYRDGVFVSESEMTEQIQSILTSIPKSANVRSSSSSSSSASPNKNSFTASTFVLKLNGGLLAAKHELERVNSLALLAVHLTIASFSPILLDLSFERLIDLSQLQHSVLLQSRVIPCVRYFLLREEEEACLNELKQVASALSQIEDLSFMLNLTLESEATYPQLRSLLEWIKTSTLIKILVITHERSPMLLLDLFASSSSSSTASSRDNTLPSERQGHSDLFALLQHICEATDQRVLPRDFFPFSCMNILSPLLHLFGLSSFHITASSSCILACPLINTSTLSSIPLNHLFDVQSLYTALKPIANRLEAKTEKLGVRLAATIESIINEHLVANLDVPPVLSYLTSSDPLKQATVQRFMRSAQLWLIHAHMDIANIDLQRRCDCDVLTASPFDARQQVAVCTGCI